MADSKTLKLLVVEDDLEDEQLVCEALLEIEETRRWCNWQASTIVPTDRLEDAVDCLRRDSFDAILLNLSLPDSPVLLDSFLDVSASAGSTPIIILADHDDENLANRLLREGAQDVLLKSELDCGPLAHAIRYAIERQRRANASRSSAFTDEVTGALAREGFLQAGSHYLQLGRTARVELRLASVELCANRDTREPLLIAAAELLRGAFQPPSLIGRWDRFEFCVLTAGLTATTVEAMLHHVSANLSPALRFSLIPLDAGGSLEEALGSHERSQAKTAILAD